eukprot:Rhum_TRINITY_DN12943_c0_g1::Rhum_TRINITY_DN12943_c0_g1_i1::g.55376::m.55376
MAEVTTAAQMALRPRMKSDSEAAACEEVGCKTRFGLVKRRHHCRGCGFIYCSEHCERMMVIPSMGYFSPVRVCHTCSVHGVDEPEKAATEEPRHNQKKEKKEK